MGKKIPEEMAKQKEKFFKGCREVGQLPDIKIHRLWELIEPFAAYGFGKAHACSYGVVAYQTAYMKANYPTQYMAAVLIAESGDMDKVPEIIAECERMGVKVLPPDVNESFKNFAMITESVIRFGMNGVKNVGEHIAGEIFRERKEHGRYESIEDLLLRVNDRDLNKKSLESLIKCGSFDGFGFDRGLLVANIENILAFSRSAQDQSATAQNSLFAGTPIAMNTKVRLSDAPLATENEKMSWEKELLGLYVTAHPFRYYADAMIDTLTPIKDLSTKPRSNWVVVGGVVDSVKKKITRSGAAMSFVTIQDLSGSLELLVFPRTYEVTKEVWVEGKMVCVVGKTGDEEGDDKLFVEKAYELTPDNAMALAERMRVNSSPMRQYVSEEAVRAPISGAVSKTNTPTVESVEPVVFLADRVVIMVHPSKIKTLADAIKKVLTAHAGASCLPAGRLPVYILVGDKKIKTQYLVSPSDALKAELLTLLSS